MSDRYYCDHPISGGRVRLAGPQARHLAVVMRARVGDRVVLFDGTGMECEASIASIGRREVELDVHARRAVDREAPVPLTLAVALPKGDRQRFLVEKAVELGVARLVPIVTQRSVVQVDAAGAERLRRQVIEASKQCGRNRLMEVEPSVGWGELAARPQGGALRLIAHPAPSQPGGEQRLLSAGCSVPSAGDALAHALCGAASIIAAIGPEGGFTGEEVALAAASGWQAVWLGPRVLRTETAALALAARLL